MLLGMGGIALASFSKNIVQDVNKSKFNKNKRVLEEAKHALLMFAYNYPLTSTVGPGRLPCPDHDNDGLIGSGVTTAQCEAVGRLPWDDPRLNFYEAKDASGETLWYAVSEEFRNFDPGDGSANSNGDDVVDSNSRGTITLVDQSGGIIYDGEVSGLAAVIIAPGPAISRDNNGDGSYETTQLRSTVDQQKDPENYLDTFMGFDNSEFDNVNSGADEDGFIIGPVFDADQNAYVINDQLIVITAAEVIAVAEKAVLDTYKKEIEKYRSNVAGLYPFLFDYNTDDLEKFESTDTTSNIGRIPSIFTNYFTETDSELIDSEVSFFAQKTFDIPGLTGQTITLDAKTVSVVDDIKFEDIGTPTDDAGKLSGNNLAENLQGIKYFYDDPTPTGWQVCGNAANLITDCYRDGSGTLTPGATSNDTASSILKVYIDLDFSAGISFTLNYATGNLVNTSYINPTATTHAEIIQEFLPNSVTLFAGTFNYETYDLAVGTAPPSSTGSSSRQFNDDSNMGGIITNQVRSNIKIGLRYYPEIPRWASKSGNNWKDSVLMAISTAYMPGGGGSCTSLNCLVVNDLAGINNNIASLLTIAGSGVLENNGLPDYIDDLITIFESENIGPDNIFSQRAGDDKVLVLQTQ